LPKKILPGNVIIGLRSSGLHSNGYTLARKVFTENGYTFHDFLPGHTKKIGEILLTPTCIYVKEILEVMKKIDVKGIAHITGGGLRKIKRMSKEVCFSLEEPFEPPEIFKMIQSMGNISNKEMYQTFNMGMGMAIVVDEEEKEETLAILKKHSPMEAKIVGIVKEGKGVEVPSLGLRY